MTGTAENRNSLASRGRWGCFFCLLTAAVLAGCGPKPDPSCDLPLVSAEAASDSVGLDEFLALDAVARDARRARARGWLTRADAGDDPAGRIADLTSAAGLAPDDPEPWLELAHIWRWLGDYLQAVSSLENAAAAVRSLAASDWAGGKYATDYLKDAQRETALIRAWLHWDRGEWQEGLDWARAGLKADPGSRDVVRITGLLEGAQDNTTRARKFADDLHRNVREDMSFVYWIRASLERSRGNYRGALNLVSGPTPQHDHAAEYYRDRAELAELLAEWSLAKRWYTESAHALPFRSTDCLTRVDHARLSPGPRKSRMPVWVAFDRYYITGSLSAYTALALMRYESAVEDADGAFWAGQVVNAAGTLLRRNIDVPWARRARGLVFADRDMPVRALDDLRRASRLLGDLGHEDARVEAALGRIYLRRDNLSAARPRLEKALRLDPGQGQAWGDLGLCLVKLGDAAGAEAAFDRAVGLAPGSATVWYNRGLMHMQAGHYDQAEADLQEAARLAPGNPEVGRLLQRIRILKTR